MNNRVIQESTCAFPFTETKACLFCTKTFRGRVDKKYCSDICRNNYHNKVKIADSSFINTINNVLRHNRRVLQELLPASAQKIRTDRESLLLKGFRFAYSTHIHTSKKGAVHYFCYDHGYQFLPNDQFMIVRYKEVNLKV